MTNTIVNHFNDVLSKSQFDINTCVEIDKEFVIFDLNNLITDSNKNYIELREILSKYRIIFNTQDYSIQFTPFFKLVQEILTFNYTHFIKFPKSRSNCKENDYLKVLFILNYFFKHPFISENALNQSALDANSDAINKTTKLSKLLDLNYDTLPENFANSANDIHITKIRGGKVKYQGTWVTCDFGIKLLKLIGGFDVLSQLLIAIFKFLSIDFKSYLSLSSNNLNKITFALNTKSVVWTQFPINYVKLREYRSESRIGQKRGKYNKTKKHVFTKAAPMVTIAPPVLKVIKPLVMKKPSVKLSPIILDPLQLKRKISYRRLSNQDFLNKIAYNHIKECNTFAFNDNLQIKNLSAGSDKFNTFTIVSPSLLSVCNMQYEKEVRYVEPIKIANIGNYSPQFEISDDSTLVLPFKTTTKELLPPFEIPPSNMTPFCSIQDLYYQSSYLLNSISPNTPIDALTHNNMSTPKGYFNESLDMSNKTVTSNSPIQPTFVVTQNQNLLEKINEPFDYNYFPYQEANIPAHGNYGYKISTRSENNKSYVHLSQINRNIIQTCKNESFMSNIQDKKNQEKMVDTTHYMDNQSPRSSKYL